MISSETGMDQTTLVARLWALTQDIEHAGS